MDPKMRPTGWGKIDGKSMWKIHDHSGETEYVDPEAYTRLQMMNKYLQSIGVAPIGTSDGGRTHAEQHSMVASGRFPVIAKPGRSNHEVGAHKINGGAAALDINWAGVARKDRAAVQRAFDMFGFNQLDHLGDPVHLDMRPNRPSLESLNDKYIHIKLEVNGNKVSSFKEPIHSVKNGGAKYG